MRIFIFTFIAIITLISSMLSILCILGACKVASNEDDLMNWSEPRQ